MRSWVRAAALALALSGCAGTNFGKLLGGIPFLHSYASIEASYKRGEIMEARKKALAFPKDHEDYPKVRRLLKSRIEPARLRLLRHYRLQAEKAEREGRWWRAMELYDQAAGLSLKPAELQKARDRMELKMRQARLDALIAQRRKEDSDLLSYARAYEPPAGVNPKDEVFRRMREYYEERVDDRSGDALAEARRYLRKGMPEIAYIEVESHLRLAPDSGEGAELRKEILAKLPKGLVIPPFKPLSQAARKAIPQPKKVTARQIRQLLSKGRLIEARRYAQVYRREGGKDAEKLLAQVNEAIGKQAEAYYQKGRIAFRKEQLDRAIRYWSRAVELMPDNADYVQALSRARLLKERLELLRQQAEEQADKSPRQPAEQTEKAK